VMAGDDLLSEMEFADDRNVRHGISSCVLRPCYA
jgi:hypothetical protein